MGAGGCQVDMRQFLLQATVPHPIFSHFRSVMQVMKIMLIPSLIPEEHGSATYEDPELGSYVCAADCAGLRPFQDHMHPFHDSHSRTCSATRPVMSVIID